MNKFRTLALAATTAVVGIAAPARAVIPPDQAPPDARYVTFVVARGLFAEVPGGTGGCTPTAQSVTAFKVASFSATLGIPWTVNAIPDRLDKGLATATGRWCNGRHLYLSWKDLAYLHNAYRWEPVNGGLKYQEMTKLDLAGQVEEACGGRDALEAKGYTRVRGEMAAAAPTAANLTDQIVNDVIVGRCGFVWARDYGQFSNKWSPRRADGTRIRTNLRDNPPTTAPYHRSWSINGGDCPGTTGWTCMDTVTDANSPYITPAMILRDLTDAPPASHTLIQWYRFVTGDVAGRWKCSGPAGTHYTYAPETYCWVDAQAVLRALPADYVATDPLTVAQAWGLAPTRTTTHRPPPAS